MVAERLLENVRNCKIPHEQNEPGIVTISIGGTVNILNYPQSENDYIKRADEALYKSKRDGRNRYTFMKM
jgi:diguanylate cyclase (GGDEF)-like protein